MKLATLALLPLLVMGCGTTPSGVVFRPGVEITLAASDVPAGESVTATLTNRSPFPIWVMANSCPPVIEVSSAGVWTPVHLIIPCTLDERPPDQIPPGGTITQTIITRHATNEALPPGTYRGSFRVAGPDMGFADWYTPEFTLR